MRVSERSPRIENVSLLKFDLENESILFNSMNDEVPQFTTAESTGIHPDLPDLCKFTEI
jgi:hypothetical protein